jgi:hypothetical protein
MKLAQDALIGIIEILRRGLVEGHDVSQLLRELDLEQDQAGQLKLSAASPAWLRPSEG